VTDQPQEAESTTEPDAHQGPAPGRQRQKAAPIALIAFTLTAAGGLVATVSELAGLPEPLILGAAAAFCAGTVLAVVEAYRRSRAKDIGFWRALGRALKTGARWIWELAP
jgi:hypothetical protein